YEAGLGSTAIAKILTKNKELPPLEYRQAQLGKSYNPQKPWDANSVLLILKNRTYVGDMVQGIYECSQFHRTPSKIKPKEEWIITPNSHEALVDRQVWERVQQTIKKNHTASGSCDSNLFFGLIKCGQCGGTMSYSFAKGKENYCCRQYRRWGLKGCSSHYTEKKQLAQIVFNDIKNCAFAAASKYRRFLALLKKHYDLQNRIPDDLSNNLAELQQRSNQIDEIIRNLYEDKINKIITPKRFSTLLKEFEREQFLVNTKIKEIIHNIDEISNKDFNPEKWLKLIAKFDTLVSPTELTREILSQLIEKIVINEDTENGNKNVEVIIYYKHVGTIDKSALKKLL
ncbi:MAG: recombinase family protein, partial [Brochothrix sp.]|uniref:recombinase family protein n=1 Tax=Brochothrix sp. TaxID=1993875 RepID=UPI00257F7AB6